MSKRAIRNAMRKFLPAASRKICEHYPQEPTANGLWSIAAVSQYAKDITDTFIFMFTAMKEKRKNEFSNCILVGV